MISIIEPNVNVRYFQNVPAFNIVSGYRECPPELNKWPADCNTKNSGFCAGAAGNIDADPALDIWGINNEGIPKMLLDDTGM